MKIKKISFIRDYVISNKEINILPCLFEQYPEYACNELPIVSCCMSSFTVHYSVLTLL